MYLRPTLTPSGLHPQMCSTLKQCTCSNDPRGLPDKTQALARLRLLVRSVNCSHRGDPRLFSLAKSLSAMRALSRLSAALSGVLLLQLSLLGSGTLCALQHAAGRSDSSAEMSGMAMGRGATAVHQAAVIAPTDASKSSDRGCGGRDAADSCGGPWAPGSCTTMSSCAWSQSTTVMPGLSTANAESGGTLPEPKLLQAGPVIAPELPPPRC